jgi:hypothetical protein
MTRRKIITFLSIVFLAGVAAGAQAAGVPDLSLSWAEMPGGNSQFRVMFNVPDGSGSTFAEARNVLGPLDATITLHLRDGNNMPIANFPAEDLWITSTLDP